MKIKKITLDDYKSQNCDIKKSYNTYNQAEESAIYLNNNKKIISDGWRIYHCPYCRKWHISKFKTNKILK